MAYQPSDPTKPIGSDPPAGQIALAITFARPSAEALRLLDRAARYLALKDNAASRRSELIAWLEEQGLSREVSRLGEPTVFNTLFVVATPKAAERLVEAPGVVSIAPTVALELGSTRSV